MGDQCDLVSARSLARSCLRAHQSLVGADKTKCAAQAQQHAQEQKQLVLQRRSASTAAANGDPAAAVTLPAPEAPRPAAPAAAPVPRGNRTPPPASPAKSVDWQVWHTALHDGSLTDE
jgi:hypothetical protein